MSKALRIEIRTNRRQLTGLTLDFFRRELLCKFSQQRHHTANSLISHLPAWQRAPLVLGALVAIIVAGRYVLRPVFRYIAESRIREAFTAAALLIVIAIALLWKQ